MSWLLLNLFRAGEWVCNKARGYCHPYCDYAKCERSRGPDMSFAIRLKCPKCGRATYC